VFPTLLSSCHFTSLSLSNTTAPKAEFRRKHSEDTLGTNDDDDDEHSLVGAEMVLDISEPGDGRNSLPAMRASAEFANLHDLGADEPADTAECGGRARRRVSRRQPPSDEACSNKEQERKWWWQKPSAEEVDESARATVLHDDSDNCAGARHGEDGEETTRDAEVIHRRKSLDQQSMEQQPGMRRASIVGMFGGGWMQQQSQQQEEEPQVDAEEAWANTSWANTSWGNGSIRRRSADDAMVKVVSEQLDQQSQQPSKPEPSNPMAKRPSLTFGIVGTTEVATQHDNSQETQAHAQNHRRASIGPASLFRGIGGATAPKSTEPTAEQLKQERLAKALQDQNLSDMLAMLKAQRNSGRAGPANKTCTNVANAIIVKEYMEVQRRASMSFTNAGNSATTGANSSGANIGGSGNDRKQPMPKRASIVGGLLGGLGLNNQRQNEEKAQQSRSYFEDSISNMTELKPFHSPARSRARSSSLSLGDDDNPDSSAHDVNPSRPPRATRRSSMF